MPHAGRGGPILTSVHKRVVAVEAWSASFFYVNWNDNCSVTLSDAS